jgi:hypothetical protein
MFYRLRVDKKTIHCVFELRDAKKISSKITAKDILNSFRKPQNYEIIKYKKGR